MKYLLSVLMAVFLCQSLTSAQSIPLSVSEQKTNEALISAKKHPLLLRDFLYKMPKGGDLHNHLVGAVYAETYIQQAVEQNYCVETASFTLIPPSKSGNQVFCKKNQVPVAKALGDAAENNDLYNGLIDAFSLRNFIAGERTGYEHFFASFSKFIGLQARYPEWLHEVGNRAAQQNSQYLELMITPDCHICADLATKIKGKSATELAKPNSVLTTWDFANEIKTTQKFLRDIEEQRLTLANCKTDPQNPTCILDIHYLFQGLRALPKEIVFAQLAFAFQLVDAEAKTTDPRMIGINLVMPEDQYYTKRDYTEQMQIVGFLKNIYPNVNVTLHAGELSHGIVPPEEMRFHINQAVHIGKAQRIGHGTSIVYEDNYEQLLKHMAKEKILVEINLSSADVILNVTGDQHPLRLYQKYEVPLAISTDDEGVLRTDITQEYQRAVETYDLSYTDLKNLVRNSIEYSFLPGESLWQERDYSRLNSVCKDIRFYPLTLTKNCENWLQNNKKAQQQIELERRFEQFEEHLAANF